jgi:hypothetical protein
MTYGVLTFIGDFPVAGQPNWDNKFGFLKNAINAAKEQHEFFKIDENNEHYTVVLDLDKDEDDDVVWIIYQDQESTGMSAMELAEKLAYGECP